MKVWWVWAGFNPTENWDESLTVGDWWDRLGPSGYAHPMLPTNAYGKGYGGALSAAVMAVMAERQVMGPPTGLGRMLAAPTIALSDGSSPAVVTLLSPST